MILSKNELLQKAETFISQFFEENGKEGYDQRMEEIRDEINLKGSYILTEEELTFGAKIAWRNSNRCIGRLFWKSLKVRDRRQLFTAEEIFKDLLEHLDYATNAGKIRSTLTVYPREFEGHQSIRIWNKQLIRFAGYELPDGSILGDPDSVEFTRYCQSLGWQHPAAAFNVLPIVIQIGNEKPKWFEIPEEKILRVPLSHPEFSWFEDLNLQWYAVPVISDMRLEIGGISYPFAPFNGWYMLTEIAVRNLADVHRYNLLPLLAKKMNLDQSKNRSLWKDKCILVLQEAVLHSFKEKGVTLVDHHTASEQFLEFCNSEYKKGRIVQADWSWIVPPTAGSTTGVFHQEWNNETQSPNFFYQEIPWKSIYKKSLNSMQFCPFQSKQANHLETSPEQVEGISP